MPSQSLIRGASNLFSVPIEMTAKSKLVFEIIDKRDTRLLLKITTHGRNLGKAPPSMDVSILCCISTS